MTQRELPAVGDRITYTTTTAVSGELALVTRTGVVTCVWFNGEGDVVDTDSGFFIPYMGDIWKPAPEEGVH